MKFKKICLSVLVSCAFLCFYGCSAERQLNHITDVADLQGRTVGVSLVWSADYMLTDRSDLKLLRYNNISNLVMALKYGQVDAIAMERPFANEVMNCISGLRIVEPATAEDQLVACINIEREDVLEDFNDFAAKFYGSEEYEDLFERLNSVAYEYRKVEATGGNKVLNVGLPTDAYPFCYVDAEDGEYAGSDVEVITRFANEYGYSLNITGSVFDVIEMGIVNGDFDMAIGTFFESCRVDFEVTGMVYLSKPYMDHEIVFMEIADLNNIKVISPLE